MIDKGLVYLIYEQFMLIHKKNTKMLRKNTVGKGYKKLEQTVQGSDTYMEDNIHLQ